MALTNKQMNFVNEYMKDMNATAAYRRAGYRAKGNAAEVNASRLLSNAKVQAEIAKRTEELKKKSDLTVEWVINELKKNHLRAIELGEMSASNKALELLGRHLGAFMDKVAVSGNLHTTQTDLTEMSPEERRARIDELISRRGS